MKRTACALALAALFVAFPSGASSTPAQVPPSEPQLPVIGGGEIVIAQMVDYVRSVEAADIVAYVVAVEAAEAEAARVAAAEAEAQAAREAASRVPASTGYSGGTTVGECTGFAIPDYIIQRESGGNPSAMNPSGAYGCAQTLLSHYSGGSCSGLDPYTIDGQRQCVLILSNGGTNLDPWAETR